jgi:exopolysaccharide production protein ExoQ
VSGETVGGFTSNLGRDTTLTGRTDVWGTLVPVVFRQPLLGSGFGGFWTYRTREVYQISEGHSGYLDVLLDLGFVGLLLVSMFLLTSCVRAGKQLENDFDWAILWIGYLIMAAVHNIAESSFDTLTSQLTAVLVFLAAASMQDSSDLPADQKRGEAGDVAG